jgi:hypothetical protein
MRKEIAVQFNHAQAPRNGQRLLERFYGNGKGSKIFGGNGNEMPADPALLMVG